MKIGGKIFLKLAIVILLLVILVCIGYILILPKYFNGSQTYSLFITGVFIAFISGFTVTLKAPADMSVIGRVLLSVFFGLVAVFLFSFLSLFLILNVRGS